MKLVPISKRVAKLLTEKPHLRDSDEKLIASIWWNECKDLGYHPEHMPASDFLQLHADGRFSKSESIRRSRQKLQEEYPEFRGKITEEVKLKLQEETKAELKNV